MTANATCTSCGTGLRATAKFCDECGLSTAADPAEYKQVTVLFADVVRSMDIAAAVDIERLREIITGLMERLAAVVRRFGGNVELTGDGVMALFGADDPAAVRACEEAFAHAERHSSDTGLMFAMYELGGVLLNRADAADRSRGLELTTQVHKWMPERIPSLVPLAELWLARDTERRGDRDAAITRMRKACDDLPMSQRPGYAVYGALILVETLIARGLPGDLAEAQDAIDALTHVRASERWAIRDVILLRLRALMVRAHGDDLAYRDLVSRHRAIAESLGYQGHIEWAEAMMAQT
jgi:hypothetical protein